MPQKTLPFTGGSPIGVAVDAAGDVFVTVGAAVVELPAGGGSQRTLPFTGLSNALGVVVDAAGDVFVTNYNNATQGEVLELPAGSETQRTLPFTGLGYPSGVAVDAAGDVFVADAGNADVVELPAGGGPQRTLPFTGLSGPSGLGGPDGVAVDASGDVFVTDQINQDVVELSPVAEPASLSGLLSGGGQLGADVSVPPGTAVSDQASLSGVNATTATGTVTYNVYSDSDCSTPAGAGSPETITTPGTLPPSASQTFSTPGTYYWQAVYSGDPYNANTTSACGSLVETVTSPAKATSLASSLIGGGQVGAAVSVPSGTPVADQALLSGANTVSATGTVTYDVYSDAACTDLVSAGTPVTITTPGTLPESPALTFSGLGSYYWQATYSGDSLNQPSTSPCGSAVETVTAPLTPTSVSTSLSGGDQTGGDLSVPAGTAVSDQASLSGANAATATGTVTYDVYLDSACTELALADAAQPITTPGVLPASPPLTATSTGTFYWQATYSGDTSNAGSTSACGSEIETVRPAYKYGADVAVILEIQPSATVPAGGGFSISVTVTNGGPKAAKNVIADLNVPSGLTVTGADGASELGRLLLWKPGTLAFGQAVTYTVTVTAGSTVTGTATVSAGALSLGTLDPDYQDNFASDQLTFTTADGRRKVTVRRVHPNDTLLRARLRHAGRAV